MMVGGTRSITLYDACTPAPPAKGVTGCVGVAIVVWRRRPFSFFYLWAGKEKWSGVSSTMDLCKPEMLLHRLSNLIRTAIAVRAGVYKSMVLALDHQRV